jgi:hypothetical protein
MSTNTPKDGQEWYYQWLEMIDLGITSIVKSEFI